MSSGRRGLGEPLWVSGFRPFFLVGALYAVALMIVWAATIAGVAGAHWKGFESLQWHGREMLFGFANAIIAGVVLTALPSWAGAAEIEGAPLALLAFLWFVGRVGSLAAPWLPAHAPMLADSLFVPALFALLARQLIGVAKRRYLLVLPILATLFAAQLAAHWARLSGDASRFVQALDTAVYAIVVLYVLVGGLLTPVFTGNVLRAKGRGGQAGFRPALEIVAVGAVVLLAIADLGGADRGWVAALAGLCAVVHGVRTARWKGWRVADDPIVLAMNLGFAWLVAAFALRAASALGDAVPETAWVHAFTVGSLGMMMLGLMTRVVLRHTGRALQVPRSMYAAGAAMFAAALLRLAASVHALGDAAVAAAALAWALAFGIWLVNFGPMLVAPSLPRNPNAPMLRE